jgi:hypothetical protein
MHNIFLSQDKANARATRIANGRLRTKVTYGSRIELLCELFQ